MSGYASVRNIYQIGDVRVEGFQIEWPEMSLTAVGRNSKFITTSRYLYADALYDMEQPEIRLSLELYNDGWYTEGQYAQRLNALKGGIVDIIGYERIESQFDKPCPCSDCDDCDCQCLLLWFTSKARIKDVNITASSEFATYSADIIIEMNAYWEVMNRYAWYVTGEGERPINPYAWDTPINEIFPFQDCDFLDADGCWVFAKKRPVSKKVFFDPEWLQNIHEYGYETYPDTGFYREFSFDNGIYFVNIDPAFSAPTKALYLFRFAAFSGVGRNWDRVTTIRFENYNNAFDPFYGSIKIFWATVNQIALENNHTWDGTELLALGDINGHFVVMDANYNVLFNVSEALVYDSKWRGNLWAGRNQLRVVQFAGMECLYFHTFRRY